MASSNWSRGSASLASWQLQGLLSSLHPLYPILHLFSIPNPLFDLAGITCGHFLVPFWTFFGATLIGKAVIKMHIQVGSILINSLAMFNLLPTFRKSSSS